MVPDNTGRVAIVCVLSVFLCVRAVAQEGYYGVGHDRWHREFYSKLNRNDGKGTCCNLMDCRPTQSRMVGDHYEVKVDGKWTPVPNDRINNVVAPDGGAHVCAPPQEGLNKGELFCVVLPPGRLTKYVRRAVADGWLNERREFVSISAVRRRRLRSLPAWGSRAASIASASCLH